MTGLLNIWHPGKKKFKKQAIFEKIYRINFAGISLVPLIPLVRHIPVMFANVVLPAVIC